MGRIVRPVDFQRVLGTSPWVRSVHFAVHHLPEAPRRTGPSGASSTKLSTGVEQTSPQNVDESMSTPVVDQPLAGWWLGMVVPKRHAKRSVTRSLLKRQIRAAVGQVLPPASALRPGLWVVRLRAPIDRKRFPSAASEALRHVVHDELGQLMGQALKRCHG